MTARSARKVTAVARIIAVVFFAVGCHATALFTSMLGVVVTPESPTMAPGASLAFTASVNGTPAGQSAVTWSLQEAGGGTVDSTGLIPHRQPKASTTWPPPAPTTRPRAAPPP